MSCVRVCCSTSCVRVWDARGAAKPRGPGVAGDGAAAPKLGTGTAAGAGRAPWLQGQAALQRSHTGFLIRAPANLFSSFGT